MDIKFKLPISRVFYTVKDGECSVLVANKDFTKFRTIQQLMEMKGETEVTCVDIEECKYELEGIKYEILKILTEKKYLDRRGELKKRMKVEEYKDYAEIMKMEETEKNKIVSVANKYLSNIGLKIKADGTVVKDKESREYERKNYFLKSGEPLIRAKNNQYRYFKSTGELLRYEQKMQEVKGKAVVSEERVQKNTEKYLDSF